MAVPHITTFCWCLGLEQGAKLIGYLHLLTSLSLMVVCSLFAESARSYIGTVEDAEDHLYSSWYGIAVGVAVVSVAHALLATSLLVSVYKRWWRGVRVWTWVMLVLFSAALVYVVVAAAAFGLTASGSDIFLSFLEGLLFFGMLAYCILCVHSYHLLLRSAADMQGPSAKAAC